MSTVVKDLGAVSAYAYAVEKGYTGTEAEFAELMADYAEVGQRAEDAADSALESKTAAQTAATTATNKASEATTAATTATTKAGEASTSASTATSAKDTAVSASQTATTKATEATTAAATAVSAKDDAVAANTAAQSAKTAAQTAQTGAETAAASVSASAAQIATNAEDISQLKSEITDKSDTADMLKAFPTDTASGSVASFADGANVPVKSLIVNIDPVQSGSGDPSPDNVRPISGHTQAVVTRTGVNVWDEEWEVGMIALADGNPISSSNAIRAKNYSDCIPSASYNFGGGSGGDTKYIFWYDSSKNYISYSNATTSIVTSPVNARYFKIRQDGRSSYNHDISINYPATDTDYHEGHVQSINISLGQTVYGGTLDVLSGELVIDRAIWALDSDSVANGGYGMPFSAALPQNAKLTTSGNVLSGMICNQLKEVIQESTWGINGTFSRVTGIYKLYFKINDDVTTIDSLNEYLALHPMQFAYPIATPLTIQLDPHEVTALLGSNNIWSDAGEVTAEYRADPTLYIQRLTEPDADMVADANITSGQYFMVGNTLYKATANIASGATISPNVNCTRKSLSEALNELNA